MRLIGVGERAIKLLIERAESRYAFRSKVVEKDTVQRIIAESRIRIEHARASVRRACQLLDEVGKCSLFAYSGCVTQGKKKKEGKD